MSRFIHLRCHTEYSLVDSLIRLKGLIKAVEKAEMPAVAMTDLNNLFGLVKFVKTAQSAGIKPIAGVDAFILHPSGESSRILLLCQDKQGYKNITRLVSDAYIKGQQKGVPYIHWDWLVGATEGLIALSGGLYGNIGQALINGNTNVAQQHLNAWKTLFPDRFYIELMRTGRVNEETYLHAAVELALATQTPVVATNDVCFLDKSDFDAHEIRVCIHEGRTITDPNRPKNYSPEQYLRTPEEMAELFSDIPEAIENTWQLAQRCNIELSLGKPFLPLFPIPEGKNMDEFFREQAARGLEERMLKQFDSHSADFAKQRKPYDERLQIELDVIINMGFPGYFLIVADFIQWAKDNNIPVGPGRGSGAGSLVAYALKITDLDPLPYDLLFERFLNPERVSMPDFDIDFCMEGRDTVIRYVADKYGHDKVSQIITYGTMAAKAVVRDVGRVLDHPYGFVDKIAKLIPFEIGITLEKALEVEETLRTRYEQEEEVRELIDMGRKLEGLTRNVGKHAGGVVISPSVLTDFSPLYCEEKEGGLVTQFDKSDVEEAGLVKFDFLGLRTLTIIKWALEIINSYIDTPLDIIQIPLDDAPTYDLLKKANTTAVFQLESRGMKELIKRLQPDCFEDIVALVALFRPGPLQSGMVDDFINRKHGREKIEYLHADLDNNQGLVGILKPTYGVIVYQEQVMQIAQVLSGYTLGGADLLRRAMGKKKPEEMAKQRTGFIDGAVTNQIKADTAGYVFDLVEKFAGYGFNKCLTGETLIADPNTGELHRIEQLYQHGLSHVLSLQTDKKIGKSHVVQVMENGIKPVFTLTTSTGKQVTATANHPFLTANGWQALEQLQAGQHIAAPSYLPLAGQETADESQLNDLANETTAFPSTVFRLNQPCLALLLGKYSIKFGNNQSFFIVKSLILAHQLQHLLLRFAIVSQITTDLESYRVQCLGQPSLAQLNSTQTRNNTFTPDIFWEEIISIIPVGNAMTYDLEVDDTHNFIANDLIVHNSHSAAYALISYQTAWLKAHHPAAFMAAVLSSDMDNTDKVVMLIDACREMGLKVLPPHVNESEYKFTVTDDQNRAICYGLGAIKGVGEGALEGIINERNKNGKFKDLFEFCRRVDLRKANRRVLEALTKAGALDKLAPNRAVMSASLDTAIKLAERHVANSSIGQNDIFGMSGAPKTTDEPDNPPFIDVADWSEIERLEGEKDSLGLYLSGHPINQYLAEISQLVPTRLSAVRPTDKYQTAKVAGLIIGVRTINSRRGRMASLTLDDNTARLDVLVYSEIYNAAKDKLAKDCLLIAEGEIRDDDFTGGYSMTATTVLTLAEARETYARHLTMSIYPEQAKNNALVQSLIDILNPHRQGQVPVWIEYMRTDAKVDIQLGQAWKIKPSDALVTQLKALIGEKNVRIIY
ncbi:DNA polymerase III subunit alpha [Beggiatoa leptomitoformis]|uniref:DNA polymerase III subunit alpha n=1 Tax=Beggiatoa leptomitoformis TaxID=288004 RepID=A0A650GDS7_9GAMM|nr:DNA polymerase III subunit alpha [Beggiatoa leptomitoformis]ALG67132.1 intein-containing DNA polymerase III subunit alpha [Beggiatoa leptomitoformis]QGX04052.1 intein-containing DNA polymerase III subunit alpha [Beggiatoa leptomitoformis]